MNFDISNFLPYYPNPNENINLIQEVDPSTNNAFYSNKQNIEAVSNRRTEVYYPSLNNLQNMVYYSFI